jgi:hypothetical protein
MKFKIVLIVLILVYYTGSVWPSDRKTVGLGIAIGKPTGPVFKYWLNRRHAVDAGIGFQKNLVIYGSYLWHSWKIFPGIEKGLLGGYIGLGGRFGEKDTFGIRSVFGLDYLFKNSPIELYLEIAPIFQLVPDTDTQFDILLGIRFYFN